MNFKWSIIQLFTEDDSTGNKNVVKKIRWALVLDQDNKKAVMGLTSLDAPTGTFVDYKDISETIALQWLHEKLGTYKKSRLESALLNSNINLNSNLSTPSLPW